MVKEKRLNDVEKVKIPVLVDTECSKRDIGRRINRMEEIVRNFLKNPPKYEVEARTIGNVKLTAWQKRQIREEATKDH